MAEDKIEGTNTFDASEKLSKEETLFQIDSEGNAIPETQTIEVYDRNIDLELMSESMQLLATIKRHNAIQKSLKELQGEQAVKIAEIEDKILKEQDESIKSKLQRDLADLKNNKDVEDVKTRINAHQIDDSIRESREIIKQLNNLKSSTTIKKTVELIPCTISEAYLAIEKGKTVEGKETTDWVADLISKKIISPKYSFEEAQRLKPSYKVALKEAVMKASNYKITTYRDLMMQQKLAEEKPLTLKKD